jgi:[acyl-carrier-protein] S-malonyltransferase
MSKEAFSGFRHDRKETLHGGSNTAWTYPGQGIQFVGMGRELTRVSKFAAKIYQIADGVLESPISKIGFEGPKELLDQTVNAQPAIFIFNYVCAKLLERRDSDLRNKKLVAGHSLGEYNALVASGALSFKDALSLVGKRGEAMKKACIVNPGGMVALSLRETDERLLEMMRRFGLEISTVNSHEQTVLGGADHNLDEAMNWIKEQGIVGTRLKVEGAFHSSLMEPAIKPFSRALNQVHLRRAEIPIVANTTATLIQTPQEIREELINQLTHPVLWKDSLVLMFRNGIGQTIEIGEKGILSNMNLKVNGGKTERLKAFIQGVAINFVIWKSNPQFFSVHATG